MINTRSTMKCGFGIFIFASKEYFSVITICHELNLTSTGQRNRRQIIPGKNLVREWDLLTERLS